MAEMADRLTKSMIRALIWLREHDGVGVLNRYGRVSAAGETASHIDPTIWLRLILAGYVEARPDDSGASFPRFSLAPCRDCGS